MVDKLREVQNEFMNFMCVCVGQNLSFLFSYLFHQINQQIQAGKDFRANLRVLRQTVVNLIKNPRNTLAIMDSLTDFIGMCHVKTKLKRTSFNEKTVKKNDWPAESVSVLKDAGKGKKSKKSGTMKSTDLSPTVDAAPSGEPINDTFDQSIDCFVVHTMRLGFRAYLTEQYVEKPTTNIFNFDGSFISLSLLIFPCSRDNYITYINTNSFDKQIAAGVADVPKVRVLNNVITMVLDRVNAEIPAIRHQATLLLGAISSVQLNQLLPAFLERFNLLGKKENDIKAFAPYQHVMAELDFCVADAERANATVAYLETVAGKLPEIKKGTSVLFPEVSLTLRNLFTRTLNPESEERVRQWNAFTSQTPDLAQRFWDAFKSIYIFLNKQISKSKHKMYVLQTQQCMLSRATEEFYFSKNPSPVDQLLAHLTTGIKDKKERFEFFEFIHCFVRDIPADIVKKDLDRFSNFMKSVVASMFNRKNTFTPEECVIVEQFLVEYSKKHIHNCVKVILWQCVCFAHHFHSLTFFSSSADY